MIRINHLIRGCEARKLHKFYSSATKSLEEVKNVLETMSLGALIITKPTVTIVCSNAGNDVNKQRKFVMDRIPNEFKNMIDFQVVVKENVGEVAPVCLNHMEHYQDPRILATPQNHLDNALYLLARKQGASASKHLWLCGSLALKNLARRGGVDPRSHKSKIIIVDYLRDQYGCYDIYSCWRVLSESHSNAYEDQKSLKQIRRDLQSTILFCNAIYKVHKKQESVEKKAISAKEFLEWFKNDDIAAIRKKYGYANGEFGMIEDVGNRNDDFGLPKTSYPTELLYPPPVYETKQVTISERFVCNSSPLDNCQRYLAWDMRRDDVTFKMPGHRDTVTCISLSENGNYLVSNSIDCTLKQWDIRPFVPGVRLVNTFQGHQHNFEKNLLKCSWSACGSFITAGSYDRFAYV